MHQKEPEKPSEHTSEHVKSAGGVPPDPPHTAWAPLYVFALGLHNPLGGSDCIVTHFGEEILFLLHYYHLFPTIELHGSKKPWNQVQVSRE